VSASALGSIETVVVFCAGASAELTASLCRQVEKANSPRKYVSCGIAHEHVLDRSCLMVS